MDTETLKTRLLSKVVAGPNGCIVWVGWTTRERGGYGSMWNGERTEAVHRMSYELHVGPIPDGLQIDHLCRNPRCIRPDHMEAVTVHENWRRGRSASRLNAVKTTCYAGHPFDEKNTRTSPAGTRRCRTCDRLWRAEPAQKAKRNARRRAIYRRRTATHIPT